MEEVLSVDDQKLLYTAFSQNNAFSREIARAVSAEAMFQSYVSKVIIDEVAKVLRSDICV